MNLRHLARRFVGSLGQAPPPPQEVAWVEQTLLPGERQLWHAMSAPDRRHSVVVARQVEREVPGAGPDVLAAALLHDVGKTASGLGTFRRVGATLAIAALGHDRAASGTGAIARYARHDELGAQLLAAAGSAPLTVAWAREHHLADDRWTVGEVGRALKHADDD